MKKKYFLLFVFFTISHVVVSQAQLTNTQVMDSTDSPNKYYFKTFLDGIVYLKNGTESSAKLNYQMQEQLIAYIDKDGRHMILDGIDNVDSVIISDFVYVPIKNKFYEKLVNGANQLLLSLYGKVKPLSTTLVVNEMKTVSKNIESGDVSSIYTNRIKKQNISLDFINKFWLLNKNGKLINIKNVKQVINAYPDKKQTILDKDKLKKIDFSKIDDVVSLIQLCNL